MPKVKDFYTYDNPKFAPLRDPFRAVTAAYQNAQRHMDTIKEYVKLELGLINTAKGIHELAHIQPKDFDKFGDILHQKHLMQEYPTTEEYTKKLNGLDEVYSEVVRLLEEIDHALHTAIEVCDTQRVYTIGRELENLQMKNMGRCETILYAWQMYDQAEATHTSYDSWAKELFEKGW